MAQAVLINPSPKGPTMALKFKKRRKSARKASAPAPKRRRRARKNPSAPRTRTRTVVKYKTRKARKNPSRRRTRRNPSKRGILSGVKMYAPIVLGVGGGLVAGLFAVAYVPSVVPAKFRGAIPAILGAIMASLSRSPVLRNIGIGFGAAGVLDLARQNIPMLALSEISQLQEIPALQGDLSYSLGSIGPTMSLGDIDTLGNVPLMSMPSLGDFDTI